MKKQSQFTRSQTGFSERSALSEQEHAILSGMSYKPASGTKGVRAVSNEVLEFLYSQGPATPVKKENRMDFD